MLKTIALVLLIPISGLIIFFTVSVVYNKIAISQISTTKQYSYSLAAPADSQNKESSPSGRQNQIQEEATIGAEMKRVEPEGDWVIYTQPEDGYSFLYPKEWFMRACSNGNYNGNLGLDPEPLDDPCISDSPPKNFQLVSLFARQGNTVDELIKEAKDDIPLIFFDVLEKKTVIDNKEYKQLVLIMKFIPAFFEGVPIPTKSVITYLDFPEKNQVILAGLGALDDDSKEADIYRKIVSSIKKTN